MQSLGILNRGEDWEIFGVQDSHGSDFLKKKLENFFQPVSVFLEMQTFDCCPHVICIYFIFLLVAVRHH